MYQGKFDAKQKKTSVDVHELVSQRNASLAEPAASKRAAYTEAPVQQVPSRKAAPVKAEASPKKQAAPRKQSAPQVEEAPEKKRKGPRLGGVIFYTLYFLFIFLFFVATFIGMKWLSGWLNDYEAAQPTTKSQEVFEYLFSDPDWATLYDAAGIADTAYEGKEEFVSYMENKVGESELTYVETSAGLTTDHKYIVKLGSEKIATFTLTNGANPITDIDIPEWQLGAVELFFEREESFLINIADGYTAYVNGVVLDDSFTIQIASTKADTTENFLPAGASSTKTYVQKITGLMSVPTVTVKNASGQDVEVSYDEETRTFTAAANGLTMTDEIKALALDTIKVYAEYGINEANRNDLSKYFDTNGDAFKGIVGTDRGWTKGNNGYSFTNESVTGYSVYSETLFSVYASADMTIKLTDGGTQEKDIHATLLFQKQNGGWKVIRMTNADVSEPVGKVRITFMNEDTVISSEFYNTNASEVDPPELSVPEGKQFVGWINKDTAEWYLVFSPDESGVVSIPAGTTLEPMTVYAYFENAE